MKRLNTHKIKLITRNRFSFFLSSSVPCVLMRTSSQVLTPQMDGHLFVIYNGKISIDHHLVIYRAVLWDQKYHLNILSDSSLDCIYSSAGRNFYGRESRYARSELIRASGVRGLQRRFTKNRLK